MNSFERFINFFRWEMEVPKPYGPFHLITLLIIAILVVIICLTRGNKSDLKLRLALGAFGFTALFFEILKQLNKEFENYTIEEF